MSQKPGRYLRLRRSHDGLDRRAADILADQILTIPETYSSPLRLLITRSRAAAPQHLAKLRARFQRAGFGTELRHGEADDPIPAMLILSDRHNNHVELLSGLRGMDPAIFSRTVGVPFMGMNLRIAGREDFIAMQCFAVARKTSWMRIQPIEAPKARRIWIYCAQ